jgi:cytochrome P450 family 6
MDLSLTIFSVVLIIFTILMLTDRYLHNYWNRCGITQLKANFLIGSIGDLFKFKKSIAEIFGEFYEKNKLKKIVGIYLFYRPALLINDTKLIQNILISDSKYFMNHGIYMDEKNDPLTGHLFAMKGEKWKNLRKKVSPLFSPMKLKMLFPTFFDCAKNLQNFIAKSVKVKSELIEVKDLMGRYTTDIIASVAFGYDCDSINDTNNIFRQIGSKVFNQTMKTCLRNFVLFLLPPLNKILKIRIADRDIEDFMYKMVQKTIELRQRGELKRNDFMQIMKNLLEHGFDEDKNSKLNLSEITAQGSQKL